MTKEKVLEKIQYQKPRLIYLSGKTCTGKTTFANYLEQHGYKKVELDKIVMESIVIPFGVKESDGFRTAYRGLEPAEQSNAFTNASKLEILKKVQESSLVIEGAIASPRVLQEIFSEELKDFLFIYFHPVNTDIYEQQILSRFVAGAKIGNCGLPKDFWQLVQQLDLDEFKNNENITQGIQSAIKIYATKSMEESKSRLENFQELFPEVVIIEV